MNRSNFQTRRKIYLFLLNTLRVPRETAICMEDPNVRLDEPLMRKR